MAQKQMIEKLIATTVAAAGSIMSCHPEESLVNVAKAYGQLQLQITLNGRKRAA